MAPTSMASRVEVHPGAAHWRCSSRRVSTAAPKWVVFEPNDEPLWAQIRLNVGAFMQNLFRQGAFQGTTPREAYFVKCDKETTTQNDINLRHRQHPGRLCAAEAGRVRDHQDSADRRPDPGLSRQGEHTMAQFTVNAQRFDPYKNFKFRVKWDGRYVAGRQQGQRAEAHAPKW